jgi:hypothetical protein
LPYKHWFESTVSASILLVNILITLFDGLYMPLVPSLNKIVGAVTDENIGRIDTDV